MSELTEDIAKKIGNDLLSDNTQLRNLGNYARYIARVNKVYNYYAKIPSKDLMVKYGIYPDGGNINYVWWLLEQLEKGNITIKENVVSE